MKRPAYAVIEIKEDESEVNLQSFTDIDHAIKFRKETVRANPDTTSDFIIRVIDERG